MEEVGIFYGHLVYFTDIWYNLWTFGMLLVNWFIFSDLVSITEKNLATLDMAATNLAILTRKKLFKSHAFSFSPK
jgi:hypothetical protein